MMAINLYPASHRPIYQRASIPPHKTIIAPALQILSQLCNQLQSMSLLVSPRYPPIKNFLRTIYYTP